MSATPARRIARQPPHSTREPSRQGALERGRRRRHFARRRRDLLEDAVAAFVLTILTITITAGLGVIALFEVPAALLLSVSYVLDRRARRGHRGSVEALASRPDRPSRPLPRPPSRRGGSNSPGTR